MTSSWISSDFTPDTVAIRDDGEAAQPAADEAQAIAALKSAIATFERAKGAARAKAAEALLAAAVTPLGHDAIPERDRWPDGHFVHIRTVRSGGDLKRMRLHLNAARIEAQAAGLDADQMNSYVGHEAILANAAAYIVRLEGEGFTDPRTYERDENGNAIKGTGEPLLIEGTFAERVAIVEDIPEAVLEYVFSEVTRRQVADPLGLQPNGTGGRSKSQTSSSRPPSRPTPVK